MSKDLPGTRRRMRRGRHRLALITASPLVVCGLATPPGAAARGRSRHEGPALIPGNLLISRSVYTPADIGPGVTVLPPGCMSGCAVANTNGEYPLCSTTISRMVASASRRGSSWIS